MEHLDEMDRKILRELRRDGRLSNTKLAETVGLSTTPCWNRVKAMEERGVIEGILRCSTSRPSACRTPSSSRSRWIATTTTCCTSSAWRWPNSRK